AYLPPLFEARRTWSLTLEVVDRCLVTFISETDSPGVPRVAAVRTDTLDLEGWMPAESDVSVVDYDISADGRYLAASVDGGATLELFALDQPGVPSADYEHVGDLLAYEFGHDARWLAVVTTNPDDAESQLLHLVRLDGETWEPVDQRSILYTDGLYADTLRWFGDDEVLFLGPEGIDSLYLMPTSWTAGTDGLHDELGHWSLRIDVDDYFFGFLTSPTGFLSWSLLLPGYFGAGHYETYAQAIEAISPSLTYRALLQS